MKLPIHRSQLENQPSLAGPCWQSVQCLSCFIFLLETLHSIHSIYMYIYILYINIYTVRVQYIHTTNKHRRSQQPILNKLNCKFYLDKTLVNKKIMIFNWFFNVDFLHTSSLHTSGPLWVTAGDWISYKTFRSVTLM